MTEKKCPICNRIMQRIYTKGYPAGWRSYATLGYMCPYCDYILIDSWVNGIDYEGILQPTSRYFTRTKRAVVKEVPSTKAGVAL